MVGQIGDQLLSISITPIQAHGIILDRSLENKTMVTLDLG